MEDHVCHFTLVVPYEFNFGIHNFRKKHRLRFGKNRNLWLARRLRNELVAFERDHELKLGFATMIVGSDSAITSTARMAKTKARPRAGAKARKQDGATAVCLRDKPRSTAAKLTVIRAMTITTIMTMPDASSFAGPTSTSTFTDHDSYCATDNLICDSGVTRDPAGGL